MNQNDDQVGFIIIGTDWIFNASRTSGPTERYLSMIRQNLREFHDTAGQDGRSVRQRRRHITNNILAWMIQQRYYFTRSGGSGNPPIVIEHAERDLQLQQIRQSFFDVLFVPHQREIIVREEIATEDELIGWRTSHVREQFTYLQNGPGGINFDPRNWSDNNVSTAWYAGIIRQHVHLYNTSSPNERRNIEARILAQIMNEDHFQLRNTFQQIRNDIRQNEGRIVQREQERERQNEEPSGTRAIRRAPSNRHNETEEPKNKKSKIGSDEVEVDDEEETEEEEEKEEEGDEVTDRKKDDDDDDVNGANGGDANYGNHEDCDDDDYYDEESQGKKQPREENNTNNYIGEECLALSRGTQKGKKTVRRMLPIAIYLLFFCFLLRFCIINMSEKIKICYAGYSEELPTERISRPLNETNISFGWRKWGGCKDGEPCGKCGGDCDTDEMCAGNLVCHHDKDVTFWNLQGCVGAIKSYGDYCGDPVMNVEFHVVDVSVQ